MMELRISTSVMAPGEHTIIAGAMEAQIQMAQQQVQQFRRQV